MKHWEMAVVSAVYLATAAAAYLGLHLAGKAEPMIALIVAAAAGTMAGAWLYSRRFHNIAGLKVKSAVGGMLAGLCLAVSIICQTARHWMADPYAATPTCVAATFVIPIVLFGTMELIFMRREQKHYRFK